MADTYYANPYQNVLQISDKELIFVPTFYKRGNSELT
jgi:hypothetical protein